MSKRFIICILILFTIFFLIGLDPRLETTNYSYKSTEIPSDFDGFKICQISDLHCKNFGKNNNTLIKAIQNMNPDIVVLTGDIVDENHDDLSSVENLFIGLQKLNLPTYFITGNHELKDTAKTQYSKLLELMETYHITDMDHRRETLTKGNSSIELIGCKWYPNYLNYHLPKAPEEGFQLLLYHAADSFDDIPDYNYDLVLSGHIHGGVIRIPILGTGVLGNTGELFPKYTHGVYQNAAKTSTMIVSRGLGDAKIPRFFNRPELVCVTLHSAQE